MQRKTNGLSRHLGEVDEAGHRLVVRNGFRKPRESRDTPGQIS